MQWLGIVGAALLGAAIIPQAIELAKRRRVDELRYGFIVLNLAGLALLAMRSAEMGEWAFVTINLTAGLFWLATLAVKMVGTSHAPGSAGNPANAGNAAFPANR